MALSVTGIGTVVGTIQVVGAGVVTATQNVAAIKSTSTLLQYAKLNSGGSATQPIKTCTISAGTSFTITLLGAGGNPATYGWELII